MQASGYAALTTLLKTTTAASSRSVSGLADTILIGRIRCLMEGMCLPGIGSHNEFDFEVAMAEHTGCHLHTFDCTVEVKDLNIPSSVQDRMTFHPTCLGADG
jgi:hypothetical protein